MISVNRRAAGAPNVSQWRQRLRSVCMMEKREEEVDSDFTMFDSWMKGWSSRDYQNVLGCFFSSFSWYASTYFTYLFLSSVCWGFILSSFRFRVAIV